MKKAKLCIALFVFFTIFISCTEDQLDEDTGLSQTEEMAEGGNGETHQDDIKP